MFDTPYLGALCCYGPILAVVIGGIIFLISYLSSTYIEKKIFKETDGWLLIAIILSMILMPLTCFASVGLEIGIPDPAPWFKPSTRNITGKYILVQDSYDILPQPENLSSLSRELEFLKDGTFNAIDIPDMWAYTDISEIDTLNYVSGSGTWYLGQEQGPLRMEWVLFAEFDELDDQVDNQMMRFYFEGHLPPYDLATLDCDYWRFHFEKKSWWK